MADFKFPKNFCVFCDAGMSAVVHKDTQKKVHVVQHHLYADDDTFTVQDFHATCFRSDDQ